MAVSLAGGVAAGASIGVRNPAPSVSRKTQHGSVEDDKQKLRLMACGGACDARRDDLVRQSSMLASM
jgi:hypothetical protein